MVSKVVLETPADGGVGLRIDARTGPLPARTPAGTELHLGSQDLIRLADYATSASRRQAEPAAESSC